MKKVILVIEDERALFNAIKFELETAGFSVIGTSSSDNGISILENIKKVNAIWLDHYLLGKETGLDFLAKLKNNPKLKKIPVFVISNTANEEQISTYMKFGAIKFFVKSNHLLGEIIKDITSSI